MVPPLPYAPMPATAGFVTVTGTVAGVAIFPAAMVAVSWFALTWVVLCAEPFQLTVALVEKLLPLTVSTKAAPPEVIESGASSVMLGMLPAAAGVVDFEL